MRWSNAISLSVSKSVSQLTDPSANNTISIAEITVAEVAAALAGHRHEPPLDSGGQHYTSLS